MKPSLRRAAASMVLALLLGLAPALGAAAAFRAAAYDSEKDELVVTLAYRGTNPNHSFRLEWGACRRTADGASNEIAARVLDEQWNDRAVRDFTRTVRFSLAGLRCRPAAVTLFTAPGFRTTVEVPAQSSASATLRGPLTDAH